MEFNEEFLQEMGLSSMPADQKPRFLAYAQEELEVRIGERISEGVSEEKLAEFDSLIEQNDAARWLEENRPDFREIVKQTIDEMKAEILARRNQLLGLPEENLGVVTPINSQD